MGDVIDFQSHLSSTGSGDELEELLRQTLDRLDDAESAPWLAETVYKMCEFPELAFDFSFSANIPADENEIRRIAHEYKMFIEERMRKVKNAMVNAFVESYIEKAKQKYLDR